MLSHRSTDQRPSLMSLSHEFQMDIVLLYRQRTRQLTYRFTSTHEDRTSTDNDTRTF